MADHWIERFREEALPRFAERTKLNRQNLYKALSATGSPGFKTIETILRGLGFRLSVEPIRTSE